MHIHHKLRIKEHEKKLPKHLDKDTFINSVNSGEIPIKIPNINNTPEEFLTNFNGIANYCNYRSNQIYKNPDLFTWTLKQQKFNQYEIPHAFLAKNRSNKHLTLKKTVSQPDLEKKPVNDEKLLPVIANENKNLNILNPPKRIPIYNREMLSEEKLKILEKEEIKYEKQIQDLIRAKWKDVIKNAENLRHRKIFSITKMQNDALVDDSNENFSNTFYDESCNNSKSMQKNHFLNPFDKKNYGINKIIHYIQEKNENNDNSQSNFEQRRIKKRNNSLSKKEINNNKEQKIIKTETESNIQNINSIRLPKKRSQSYLTEFENMLENIIKIKTENNDKANLKNLRTDPNIKALLTEDNILNYNSYFSKRYYNGGFRLELSEKTKNAVKNFENNIRKSIEKLENRKKQESLEENI